jgi:hypothetical protein
LGAVDLVTCYQHTSSGVMGRLEEKLRAELGHGVRCADCHPNMHTRTV